MFNGRKMANGQRFDASGTNAASRTLPLGTSRVSPTWPTARAPSSQFTTAGLVADRIVDLSPKTAEDIGIKPQGVARVEVAPITVPLPDGRMLLGAAARAPGESVAVR